MTHRMVRGTQADRVYAEIRRWIIDGELAEGEELNHVALAKHFGTSRIPVREALQRLSAERLLTSSPFRGHQVPALTADEIGELIEIRRLLECLAVRRHAPAFGPDQIAHLRTVNERLRATADPHEWLRGDWEFHRLLCGGDTVTADFVGDIRRRINRYLDAATRMGDRHVSAVDEHAAIVEALESGDVAEAERRLARHIEITGEALAAVADAAAE